MITWMTRMSYLDTAADLDSDMLMQLAQESSELVREMLTVGENQSPTVRMWQGYEVALAAYSASMEVELATRGVFTHLHLETATLIRDLGRSDDNEYDAPPWLEDADVLRSHRSNLVRRWPEQYGNSWAKTPELWPYIWPFVSDGGYVLMLSKHDKKLLASGERVLPKKIIERIENI